MIKRILCCSIWFLTLSLLVACGGNVSTATPFGITPVSIPATFYPNSPTTTPLPTKPATSTPLPATETQQAWFATAKAIRATENAATQQAENSKSTQIAQFPVACEGVGPYGNSISSNGEWIATTCGYKANQTLIAQNKEGIKWVLEFKDFLSPIITQDGGVPMGSLYPKFWSPDGAYLYFTPVIGYDGGGDECFPGFGDDGLFRLDLKSGLWATLIPPTDSLLGYEIKFSPTGRRYATDLNGVMITDLKTGEVSRIDLSETVEGILWSPDGTQLAFTVASCGEQGLEASSVYVWDALKNEKRILFTTNEMVLRPQDWIDNSTFRISGEKIVDHNMAYTIYVFDTASDDVVFSGTATPNP